MFDRFACFSIPAVGRFSAQGWLEHGPERFGVVLWSNGALTALCRIEMRSLGIVRYFSSMAKTLDAFDYRIVAVNLSEEQLVDQWGDKLHKLNRHQQKAFYEEISKP